MKAAAVYFSQLSCQFSRSQHFDPDPPPTLPTVICCIVPSIPVWRVLGSLRMNDPYNLDGNVVHQKLGNLVIGCALTCTLYGVLVLVCF